MDHVCNKKVRYKETKSMQISQKETTRERENL